MNFLAHIYLSGQNPDLIIGNFIADHIKGSALNDLPKQIQNGVRLHRKIDHFTDHHPVVDASKKRMQPLFRKYSPVVADIYYDHFLACHFSKFSKQSLEDFASGFYQLTYEYDNFLPERTRNMLPYMIDNNWLVTYRTLAGVDKVMKGMAKRTPFRSGMEHAAMELEKNYTNYESEFFTFFEELQLYTQQQPEFKF